MPLAVVALALPGSTIGPLLLPGQPLVRTVIIAAALALTGVMASPLLVFGKPLACRVLAPALALDHLMLIVNPLLIVDPWTRQIKVLAPALALAGLMLILSPLAVVNLLLPGRPLVHRSKVLAVALELTSLMLASSPILLLTGNHMLVSAVFLVLALIRRSPEAIAQSLYVSL